MDELFSPQAQRLLDRALLSAQSQQIDRSGLPELLAAFIDLLDPLTPSVLGQSMQRWQSLRQDLPSIPLADSPHVASISWTPGAAEAIRRAKEIALSFRRHEQVHSTDLLIAVLETSLAGEIIPSLADWPLAQMIEQFHRDRLPPLIQVPLDIDWKSSGHPDTTDLYQIIDANLNRAREGLRVLDEFARFTRGDANLSGLLKSARHRLALLEHLFPAHQLLAARDVSADVGATQTSPSEMTRETIAHVATASIKRVQEALRVIEEYSKISHPQASQQAKSLRFDVYQLERFARLAYDGPSRLSQVPLYWICDPYACKHELEWTVQQAIVGGVGAIQLRDKQGPDRQTLHIARQLRAWTRQSDTLFIVNDRPDIARLADADAVHVGQDELTVRDARRIVGPEIMVGVSTHSIDQAHQASANGASYIGIGPVFPSKTKAFEQHLGTEPLRQIVQEISIPIFAIGGIDLARVAPLTAVGIRQVAVSHAISHSDDPAQAATELRSALSSISSEA
jgi:thiamine-phosphate pyrophosphorylase